MRDIDGERFVALPAGTPDRPFWTVGRTACLEAVERVKDLYDRVRTGVGESLRELSAQYERERTQHAAQIATLRRQVQHFAGQVMRLTADYRTLAETSRGRWR